MCNESVMRTPDSDVSISSAGQPDPNEPELGSLPDAELPADTDVEELKTGTTTVGLRAEDGVVMATDMRASLGTMVSSKTVQKVEQIHPTGALTIAGSVSAAQSLIDTLRAESNLYEARRDVDLTMTALATLTRNLLRCGAFFIVVPVLGGVDEEGPHVYSMDALGGTTEENYATSGSGSQFALGVLEQRYDESLDTEGARDVAIDSLKSALERDTATGNGINIATVTDDGVEIERFEDLDEI